MLSRHMYKGKEGRRADLHPGLLMQMCDVELAARRMRHQLVMLLQDLMEALQGKNVLGLVTLQQQRCKA